MDEIYHDESLGAHINIVLVRLIIVGYRQVTNTLPGQLTSSGDRRWLADTASDRLPNAGFGKFRLSDYSPRTMKIDASVVKIFGVNHRDLTVPSNLIST